jgi:hypothetical protein
MQTIVEKMRWVLSRQKEIREKRMSRKIWF